MRRGSTLLSYACGGMRCPTCGTENAPDSRFCGGCGARLAPARVAPTQTTDDAPYAPPGQPPTPRPARCGSLPRRRIDDIGTADAGARLAVRRRIRASSIPPRTPGEHAAATARSAPRRRRAPQHPADQHAAGAERAADTAQRRAARRRRDSSPSMSLAPPRRTARLIALVLAGRSRRSRPPAPWLLAKGLAKPAAPPRAEHTARPRRRRRADRRTPRAPAPRPSPRRRTAGEPIADASRSRRGARQGSTARSRPTSRQQVAPVDPMHAGCEPTHQPPDVERRLRSRSTRYAAARPQSGARFTADQIAFQSPARRPCDRARRRQHDRLRALALCLEHDPAGRSPHTRPATSYDDLRYP